jgi:hypothetical protein
VEAPEFTSSLDDDALESTIKSVPTFCKPENAEIAASTPLSAVQCQDELQQAPAEKASTGLWADVGPVLKFAVPTLCIAVTSPLMSLADTSVVGLYSESQLAAMSPATSVIDGLYYMMTFIPMAVTNLVSLHMARKNHAAAGAFQLAAASLLHSAQLLSAHSGTAVPCFFILQTHQSFVHRSRPGFSGSSA